MKMGGEAQALVTIFLAVVYARTGRNEAARAIFAQLQEAAASQYLPPFYLALIAANLGDKDQVFDWLETAYRERSGWMPWLKHKPLLGSLHQDAQFNDLLRCVGLKP
jgi:hypothetical protein